MARTRTIYVCQECGYQAPKWMGRCDECGAWNSLVEGRSDGDTAGDEAKSTRSSGRRPRRIDEIRPRPEARIRTGMAEFDRVVGGGLMRGSLTLIAGAPGIGKSTLMTELGRYLADRTVLYVSGEESAAQVKSRAQRLGVEAEDLYLFTETDVEEIVEATRELEPDLLVVDSIQTLQHPDYSSAPGSVTQVRESTASLTEVTKGAGTATFLVGHVTKEGSIAGPRVLEHMVDTVLQFEGDRHHSYRMLRTVKNRFGPTHEVGLFEMRDEGLREVTNPSELFLSETAIEESGSAVVCAMEGTRPLLVEIQALVAPTSYSTPQRTASGFDMQRLKTLLAVLEKREGLTLSEHDVFVNVAGGVRLTEPAVDLGVALAVTSSFRDEPVRSGLVAVGEVGLNGEVRAIARTQQRVAEAAKLGFDRMVLPRSNAEDVRAPEGVDIAPVGRLREAIRTALEHRNEGAAARTEHANEQRGEPGGR